MSRPRDWAIVSGLPDDLVRDYPTLPNGRLLTSTLNQTQLAILNGDYYRTFREYDVTGGSSTFFKFTAPAAPITFALTVRQITPEVAGINYRVYSGATGIVTTGTPWSTFNENGLSSKTSTSLFEDVASYTDIGTLTDIAKIPQSASGGKIAGSPVGDEGFKIVAPGEELLIEIENTENTTNNVLLYYFYAEVPPGIL